MSPRENQCWPRYFQFCTNWLKCSWNAQTKHHCKFSKDNVEKCSSWMGGFFYPESLNTMFNWLLDLCETNMHTWLICHILRWCKHRVDHILKFKGRGSCRPLVHTGSKSLLLAAESVCVEPRGRCLLGTKGLPRELEV